MVASDFQGRTTLGAESQSAAIPPMSTRQEAALRGLGWDGRLLEQAEEQQRLWPPKATYWGGGGVGGEGRGVSSATHLAAANSVKIHGPEGFCEIKWLLGFEVQRPVISRGN